MSVAGLVTRSSTVGRTGAGAWVAAARAEAASTGALSAPTEAQRQSRAVRDAPRSPTAERARMQIGDGARSAI